jgi:small-conductance mechanosensitive channel
LAWVPFEKGLVSKSSISMSIYNSFDEHGIVIPFPQQDVYIKQLKNERSLEKDLFENKTSQNILTEKGTKKNVKPSSDNDDNIEGNLDK